VKEDARLVSSSAEPPETVTGTGENEAPFADAIRRDHLLVRDARRYELIREAGRGGLGRVLEAYDRDLGRSVALKELIVPSARSEARFVREAKFTARLEHPSIVPVHDAGRWPSGEAFYSMKLVSGRSLRDCIAEAPGLNERLALVQNVIAVADALAYAHSKHIIHRDLKPANVIVGSFGETIVIDWGLAKDLSEDTDPLELDTGPSRYLNDSRLTVVGEVVGTPSYMAPEQARGEAVDARADVYSLGAILYHVLTGEKPYSGRSPADTLERVAQGSLTPLRLREPRIPDDLAAIVEKAMHTDAANRYPTAAQLAADLRLFSAGQLVSARDYSAYAVVHNWIKRHRAAALAVAVTIAATVGSVIGIAQERNQAQRDRDRAQQLAAQVKGERDRLILTQAQRAMVTDPTEAVAWLKTYPDDGDNWRVVAEMTSEARSRGVATNRFTFNESVTMLAFADSSGVLISGTQDGLIAETDLVTGTSRTLVGNAHMQNHFALSSDAGRLAYVSDANEVVIVDRVSGNARVLAKTAEPVLWLVFSKTNETLVVATAGYDLRLFDLRTNRQTRLIGRVPQLSRDGRYLVFERHGDCILRDLRADRERLFGRGSIAEWMFVDDTSLVVSTSEGRVFLHSLDTNKRDEIASTGAVANIRLSPNAKYLAIASRDSSVRLYDLKARNVLYSYRHRGKVFSAAFSPNSELLATAGDGGQIVVLDTRWGNTWKLDGHSGSILGPLTFSPDGERLASGSYHGEVRIWQPPRLRPIVLRGHEDAVFHARFSPAGAALVTDSRDHTVREWRLSDLHTEMMVGHKNLVFGVGFSHSGDVLATSSWDGTARLWGRGGRALAVFQGHEGHVRDAELVGDKLLVTGGADGTVRLWKTDGSPTFVGYGHTQGVYDVTASADGTHLASASEDHTVRVWDISAGTSEALRGHEDVVYRVLFSASTDELFSAGWDGRVMKWNAKERASTELFRHNERVRHITLARNKNLLASTGEDGVVVVMRAPSWRAEQFKVRNSWCRHVAFSPDAAVLAAACQDGTVRLWDLAQNKLAVVAAHEDFVVHLEFSPDGTQFATASWDRTARIWNVRDIVWSAVSSSKLRRELGLLTAVETINKL
jgi:eukaryotic-like serine/threonine-protein kinase